MRIDRRTLLAGLMGSGACLALKPMAGRLSLAPPPVLNDIYVWLHGLMAIVIDQGKISILSPTKAMNHVHKFGRIIRSNDLSGIVDLPSSCSVQMSGRPSTLPPRDPHFFSQFVVENVTQVDTSQSAFNLALPYPDEILPIRTTQVVIRSYKGSVLQSTIAAFIPTAIILHYLKVDMSSTTVTGLSIPSNNGQPIHVHVFVEPDPTDEAIHDAQPDVDELMNMFPGQNRVVITPPKDPCEPVPPKRHCHPLPDITAFPGATVNALKKVTEQRSIYEWRHQCGDQPPTCAALTTYETGACPPRILLMQGVSWPISTATRVVHKGHAQKTAHEKK
jgi:hypothetical protein